MGETTGNTLPRNNSGVTASRVNAGVDANRVMEVFDNAIYAIKDILGLNVDFGGSIEAARSTLSAIVYKGVAPITVTLPLKNNLVDDLVLHVDVKKRKCSISMSKLLRKRAAINSVLRAVSRG